MSSNSNDIQATGSDTRPPILDRTDYESWSQRIQLDTLGTTPEEGVLLGPERARTYDDLNDNEKKRFDADVRATNIVLQGLPKDIYKLINHNIEAKSIWDNVKMLLAGSELTKEDMRSSFKLNKGLKETNHEQLYAYLKQHEKHVAQDRLIIERITPPTNDPLAFVSSVQPYSQPSQRQHNQNQRYFARGNGAAGFGGTQNRARNANACQGKPIKWYNCNGIGHIARNCTQLKRPQNSDYFKDKMLLMQAKENRAVLDEEDLLFLVGEQPNTFDVDVDNQPVLV
ncbi:retrovirus-related pol polyprotein from transposon TNT 1-94 [Tanacetum coccineum]